METLPPGRRQFLARIITSAHALIAGTLGVVFGGAIVSPGLTRQQENWLTAARLTELPNDLPMPVTINISRQDGYVRTVERRTVFLVKTGENQVTALDSTCTHLGCRVSWDGTAQELRCPCHGGVYDKTGAVKAGPPPAPLARLETRIDDGRVLVHV